MACKQNEICTLQNLLVAPEPILLTPNPEGPSYKSHSSRIDDQSPQAMIPTFSI
jgi:hypothetical protein